MMALRLKIVFAILILSFGYLASCDSHERSNNGRKGVAIDSQGRKDTIRINDSTFIKITKDENGLILDSVTVVNGRVHGLVKRTYKGKIYYRNFVNGKQHGYSHAFYKNGSIAEELYFDNNKKHGEAIMYYPSGDFQSYRCYDWEGNLGYIRNYDNQGNIIESDGILTLDYSFTDTIVDGDYFKLQFHQAKPPNTILKLYIGIPIEGSDSVHLSERIFTQKDTEKMVFFKERVFEEGRQVRRVYWRMTDTLRSYDETGNKDFEFLVIPLEI